CGTACNATRFYTVTPCRVVDTRDPDGPRGGPALLAGATRSFPVTGVCGIPGTAASVAVNQTVTGQSAAGDLRAYPAGGLPPATSTINFGSGQTRANNAIVQLGAAGQISIQCDMPGGSTHF